MTRGEIQEILHGAAETWGDAPNVGRMAVLLHPHVYTVWRRLNPQWHIARSTHPIWGQGYTLVIAYGRRQTGEEFRGYWNPPCAEYFAHHPTNAWAGVRRHTDHQFVEDLVSEARGWRVGSASLARAEEHGLKVIRDAPEGVEVCA